MKKYAVVYYKNKKRYRLSSLTIEEAIEILENFSKENRVDLAYMTIMV